MLTDLVENSLGWFWSNTISLGRNNVGFLFGGAALFHFIYVYLNLRVSKYNWNYFYEFPNIP